jgi:hypothetical protein
MAIVSSIKCFRCLGSLGPDEVHENEADCRAAGWKKPGPVVFTHFTQAELAKPQAEPEARLAGEVRSDVHYPATAADVRDQRWLADRLNDIESGIEAVLDIARNWTEVRNLSRLHPGESAQAYILAHVKHPLGPGVVVPLLAESNWSQAQIAEIAGVSTATVSRTVTNVTVERPDRTLGADGKLRPARVVREVSAQVLEPAPSVEPETIVCPTCGGKGRIPAPAPPAEPISAAEGDSAESGQVADMAALDAANADTPMGLEEYLAGAGLES